MKHRLSRVVAESGPWGAVARLTGRMLSTAGTALGSAAAPLHAPQKMRHLTSRRLKQLLEPNRIFAQRHKGERCYILGTGPSLASQDLAALSGETLFTVNQGFLQLQETGHKPTYAVVIDECYFAPDMANYLSDLLNFCGAHRVSLFANAFHADVIAVAAQASCPMAATAKVRASPVAQTTGPFATAPFATDAFATKAGSPGSSSRADAASSPPQVNYLAPIMRSRQWDERDRPVPLDIAYCQPGYESVIHAAIVVALYMGFDEIVLLGCDMDYHVRPHDTYRHSYSGSPYLRDDQSVTSLFAEGQVQLMERALAEYRAFANLGRVAQARGQRIFNATAGGVLDVFPRKPLSR